MVSPGSGIALVSSIVDVPARVLFSGMSDELTNYLVKKTRSKTPLVIKCVPLLCLQGYPCDLCITDTFHTALFQKYVQFSSTLYIADYI
jgi:hypothetical protein